MRIRLKQLKTVVLIGLLLATMVTTVQASLARLPTNSIHLSTGSDQGFILKTPDTSTDIMHTFYYQAKNQGVLTVLAKANTISRNARLVETDLRVNKNNTGWVILDKGVGYTYKAVTGAFTLSHFGQIAVQPNDTLVFTLNINRPVQVFDYAKLMIYEAVE